MKTPPNAAEADTTVDVYALAPWLIEAYGLTWRQAVHSLVLPVEPVAARPPVDLDRFEAGAGR